METATQFHVLNTLAFVSMIAIACILVENTILMRYVKNFHGSINLLNSGLKHQQLKADYFHKQARAMQIFFEKFLGREFNVQCVFSKMSGECAIQLWIWRKYENRDMGVAIEAMDTPELIEVFMQFYYKSPYFTEAMAFPDRE